MVLPFTVWIVIFRYVFLIWKYYGTISHPYLFNNSNNIYFLYHKKQSTEYCSVPAWLVLVCHIRLYDICSYVDYGLSYICYPDNRINTFYLCYTALPFKLYPCPFSCKASEEIYIFQAVRDSLQSSDFAMY